MSSTKGVNTGFTMIELIVVIVILGILAATALPKFINLRGDAIQAVAEGMAAQLASGMTINYAGCSAKGHVVTPDKCQAVSNCTDGVNLLAGGAFPTDGSTYAITAAAIGAGTAGANSVTVPCTLTVTKGGTSGTATFTGVSAGL